MAQRNSEFWARARRARDKLIDRYIHHPDVNGIDIGAAPEGGDEIVLRIHVQERWVKANPKTRAAFPEEEEGIRVVVGPRESTFQKRSSRRG
jgi:hypothetical protein